MAGNVGRSTAAPPLSSLSLSVDAVAVAPDKAGVDCRTFPSPPSRHFSPHWQLEIFNPRPSLPLAAHRYWHIYGRQSQRPKGIGQLSQQSNIYPWLYTTTIQRFIGIRENKLMKIWWWHLINTIALYINTGGLELLPSRARWGHCLLCLIAVPPSGLLESLEGTSAQSRPGSSIHRFRF